MENRSFVVNGLGRKVPVEINGKKARPFMGRNQGDLSGLVHAPQRSFFRDYPEDGNKVQKNLKEALINSGLKDGMTLSTHHHLRDGDLVAVEVFKIAKELGVRDLVWFPSASFPCHGEITSFLEDGTLNRIEGSMNGALGEFCSAGKMKGTAVLRSHGGRCRAVIDGEVKIDIAILAAPTADPYGNSNGLHGDAACGGLGYGLVDSKYGDKVIVVTDNLVNFPAFPAQIEGNYVDFVVEVDKIGIAEKIVSGTTRITNSPDRLYLAELTGRFCEEAGLIKDGFSFQSGAGGTSLAIVKQFHERLKARGEKASFAVGGSTKYLVRMLEEGTLGAIMDAQAFDLDAVRSMRENSNHFDISVFHCYDPHSKGNYTTMMDVMILGATELDVDFNGNVVTHSDGKLLHGIGGWQNCLHAKCTIIPVPLFRGRVPVIREQVTTICGPGELVDVIVTERGIAINPCREDLLDRLKGSSLPIRKIEDLYEEAIKICGKPSVPETSDEVVAAIQWIDGTVIDTVKKVVK